MTAEPRFPGLAAVHGLIAVLGPRAGIDGSTSGRLARTGDGRPWESGAVALASRWLDAQAWWSDGRTTCVLDGRLHDREDLARALGQTPETSDAQLVALAVTRWRDAAPSRLRGSYAYVVWSEEDRRGWLAQDHLGGRSLYVLRDGPRWIVASELRLVLEVASRRPPPDPEGVIEWLGGRAMHDGQMLHLGVRRYGGGYSGYLGEHGVTLEPYWTPRYQGVLDVTRYEAAEILREALRTAIRRRVGAGERVGVSLSGGIDSTAVAAGLVHWCGDLGVETTAYSLVMPEDQPDELRYIDVAVSELGLPGFRGIPSGDGALWHALWHHEAFALPLVTPGTVLDAHLIRAAAERGEGALLDGQGGDELFGHAPYLLADLARTGRWIEAWHLLHSSPWYGERPAEWQLRSMLRGQVFRGNTPRWYDRRRPDQHQLTPTCLRPDLAVRHRDRIDPFGWKRRDGPRWWAHRAGQLTELRDIYWVSDLLRRRGRLEGIESRSPLLDVDLVETMLRLPPCYAFDPELDRYLLRHSLRGMLPEAIRARRWKANYGVVNHRWLVRILPALITLVGAPNAEIRAYLDPSAVERLLRTVRGDRDPGVVEWGPQLWTLASAELWLRAESGHGAELRALAASTRATDDQPIASPWRRPRKS